MMTSEILSIAIINYYTSSPELFRPTNIQMNQVKNLFTFVHTNLQIAIELILSKLPTEMLATPAAAKLQALTQ
jgi:archaellum biogenesis protein FlaJ (TadC family)